MIDDNQKANTEDWQDEARARESALPIASSFGDGQQQPLRWA